MGSSMCFAGRGIVQQVDGAESADRNNGQCHANTGDDESDTAALLLRRWSKPRRHAITLTGRKSLLGGRVKGATVVSGLERLHWRAIRISTRHWCTGRVLWWITCRIMLALTW